MDAPTEQDRIYANRRVRGDSQERAAQAAGYSRTTGQRREQESWYPDLEAEERARLIEGRDAWLDGLMPKSFDLIERSIDEGNVSTAIWAVEMRYGKATQRQEHSGEIDIAAQVMVYIPDNGREKSENEN